MPTVSLDAALKNLKSSGLTGSTLANAEAILRKQYETPAPAPAPTKTTATKTTTPQANPSKVYDTSGTSYKGQAITGGTYEDIARQIAAIDNPASVPKNVSAPTTTTPNAPSTNASYMSSSTANADATRKSLEKLYKDQIAQKDKAIEASNIKIAGIESKQKGIIENDVNPLLTPFREELEKSERERLSVEKNYFENQKLTDELDTLLTEGNTLIEQQKGITGLDSIRGPRVQQTIDKVTARAGVIQAVMAARNGQIAVATNLIDRSINAIAADRNDRLTYYNTLLDFYENTKDDEGKKLFRLEDDKKEFINKQIGLVENDLSRLNENADYIKKLMVTPESAAFMANAGVTLLDSPDEVARKMGAQGQRQSIEDTKNEYIQNGYEYVPYATDTTGLVSVDVGGTKLYFKPGKLTDTKVGGFNVLRDASGKIISTRSSDDGGTPGPGGQVITSKQESALKDALNQSKFAGAEADGKYADPSLYYANYQSFIDSGGNPSEFLGKFPPKSYINPANTWLPEEIMRYTGTDDSFDSY